MSPWGPGLYRGCALLQGQGCCLGAQGLWPGTQRTLGDTGRKRELAGSLGSGALHPDFSEVAPSPLETQHSAVTWIFNDYLLLRVGLPGMMGSLE